MIAVTDKNAPLCALKSLKHVCYKSKLYQVSFKKDDLLSLGAISNIDVSFA